MSEGINAAARDAQAIYDEGYEAGVTAPREEDVEALSLVDWAKTPIPCCRGGCSPQNWCDYCLTIHNLDSEITGNAALIARLSGERDAYKIDSEEAWAWLDDALKALGVKTVFDIKDRAGERERLREALDGIAHWRGSYNRETAILMRDHARAALSAGADE